MISVISSSFSRYRGSFRDLDINYCRKAIVIVVTVIGVVLISAIVSIQTELCKNRE